MPARIRFDDIVRTVCAGNALPDHILAQVLEVDVIVRKLLVAEYAAWDDGPGPNPADHPDMTRPQLRDALAGIVIQPWRDRIGKEGEPWPCAVVEDGWRCAHSGPAPYCWQHTAVIARRLNEGDVFLAAAARMISNGNVATAAKLAGARERARVAPVPLSVPTTIILSYPNNHGPLVADHRPGLVDELADAETAEPDSRTHGAHGIGYQPIAP